MTSDRADVLLAGAGGPLGVALAERLARPGRRIVTTRRAGADAMDVSDTARVSAILAAHAPRALVYLVSAPAAAAGDPGADLRAVLETAASHGLERVVLTSSAAVYGDEWNRPIAEDDALGGSTEYARGKIEAERIVAEAAERLGISAISLRIFNVFGGAFRRSLIHRLIEGPPPELMMTSSFVRDYVHAEDVTTAIALALADPSAVGAVNVGSGIAMDNLDLAARVPSEAYLAGDDTGRPSYSVADTSRAAELLGFEARIDVRDCLRAGRLDV